MTRLELANITDRNRGQGQSIIALHHSQPVSRDAFIADVAALAQQIRCHPVRSWALFCRDAYPFAAAFFALLHEGRDIVLPGNFTETTRQSLQDYCDGLIGDMPEADIAVQHLPGAESSALSLPKLDPRHSRVTIFTSGSTGKPKAISKHPAQLESELAALEKNWGEQLADSRIISTVSHQHIYGLLFRVLWPLATGRCFVSEQILDNGVVFHQAESSTQKLAWVASPAHLKRLYQTLDWPAVADRLALIFSSGGPLPNDAANLAAQLLGQWPVEVFGSSETGGIAWRRQQPGHERWQPLPGVRIQVAEKQRLSVQSGHINLDGQWHQTDDAVRLFEDDRFQLLGRLDRIVKLEEKRLSLVELEAAIITTGLVSEAYCLVLEPDARQKRQILTGTVVLNEAGRNLLAAEGRPAVIKLLKSALQKHFELSLIPRKWRFVAQMPVNAQAKMDIPAIKELMRHDVHS